MILLRVGTDIVTYKGDQFQIIPTLQDPITQAEFEEHGIEPDVLNGITEEEWALFKQDFNAQTFTVIVFTTYEDEPELVYNINSKALLGLDFFGVATHQIPLVFQASVWSSLPVDFENVHAANFPLHLAAQADDFKDFRVSFEPFVEEQGYIVLRVGDAYYSLKNNTVTFLSEFEGTVDDFEQYGMTPEDVRKLAQETWRDFTISCDATEFDILVFTTFDDEPEVILDATELITFAAFDAILPTNVWKDNSFVIEVDSQTEPEGYPAQSVYYEIYKGTPENLLFSGMTPGSHIVENIEDDTVFILSSGYNQYERFTVIREDEDTLSVMRTFPFEGAEWKSDGVSFSEESKPANKWMLGFDGNSSGVAIPPELNLYNSSFTKECWFYKEDSTRGIIFGTYKTGSTSDVNLEFTVDNRIRVYWTSDNDIATPVTIPLNEWIHLAWVRDEKADEQRIYINGELAWTHPSALPDREILHSSWIGRDNRTGTTVFKGKLDEVRIWDVARTEEEIKSTLNKKLLLHPLGLRAYFAFEEGEGTTTVDVASRYAGTLNNTLWLPAEVSLVRKPPYVEGATAHLSKGVSGGVLKTNHSQVVTLGRKNVSSIEITSSLDTVEDVVLKQKMELVSPKIYEIAIPRFGHKVLGMTVFPS